MLTSLDTNTEERRPTQQTQFSVQLNQSQLQTHAIKNRTLVIAGPHARKSLNLLTQAKQCWANDGETLVIARGLHVIQRLSKKGCEALDGEASGTFVFRTCHQLAMEVVRKHGDLLGYRLNAQDQSPALLDEEHALSLLPNAIHRATEKLAQSDAQAQLAAKRLTQPLPGDFNAIADEIAKAKSDCVWPTAFALQTHDPFKCAIREVYAEYESLLKAKNALDLGGCILQAARLIADFVSVRNYWQSAYRAVLIDECQEFDLAMFWLLSYFVELNQNVFVAGNPRHAIDGRGSRLGLQAFALFQRCFRDLRVVELDEGHSAGPSPQPTAIQPSSNSVCQNPLIEAYGDQRQWVLWRSEMRNDKPTKVPYQINGKLAQSDCADTWATYGAAHDALERSAAGRFDGIGIMFPLDGLLLGVDCDGVLNGDSVDNEQVVQLVQAANTYVERSPSGKGLHLFLRLTSELDLVANRHKPYEVYCRWRYFTFTGKALSEQTLRTVSPDEAAHLIAILGYPWKRQTKAPRQPVQAKPLNLDDAQLLRRMFGSSVGSKIRRLWSGNTSGYASTSEADLALVNYLTFWTGHDWDRIERLWLSSELGQRAKAVEREDYRTLTISKAMDGVLEDYRPRQ